MIIAMKVNVGVIVVATVLSLGVGFTVWDYMKWKHAETDQFGKGPSVYPVLKLTHMYQSGVVGVRIKYPTDWKATESKDGVISLGSNMKVVTEKTDKNLTDIADEFVKNEIDAGKRMAKEREYINTDQVSVTVLTFEYGDVYKKVGLAWEKGKLVRVVMEGSVMEIVALEPTFLEMVKTLVII